MDAAYVFAVRFRLHPGDVAVDPVEFETTVRVPAAPPGEDDWLFFRNVLWRGELNNEAYLRDLATEWLGVDVVDVSFREFRTDDEYFEALKAEIGETLETFRADDATEAVHKYFGSSVHVR